MKILCVAEKPSMAKSIAQLLSNSQYQPRRGKNKYCMNYDFPFRLQNRDCEITVTSVLGHLMSVDFEDAYKKWLQCSPVELFHAPLKRQVSEDMKEVAQNLSCEARRAQELLIWTDCDREGENIGWEIVQVCQQSNPRVKVYRARFSVVSQREILRAINQLHQLDYLQAEAVNARIELDLRIGASFTRFQTLQFGSKFQELDRKIVSYGSCQFPTLGFVVEQYWKRENFVVDTFWYIDAVLEKNKSQVKFSWLKNRVFDRKACIILYERCVDNPMATVLSVNAKPTSKWRPLPLTTVELQKFGASVLKINSHRIMSIAEDLYNKGFISYPRTETDEFENEFDLQEVIEKQVQDRKWGAFAQSLQTNMDQGGKFKWPRKGRNNDKAHPPIHPTKHTSTLTQDDARVYEFITRRFLACCADDAHGRQTTVQVYIAEQKFEASGLVITQRNYLDVYPYEKWNANFLPEFVQGERMMPFACEMHEGKTSPPQLLTEADLIAIMDKNGIGTDATIAEHIKKVQDREYVFKDGQYFVPSTLGLALVEGYDQIGFEQSLAKPALRSVMEQRMKDIGLNVRTKQAVIDESVRMYRDMFVKADQQQQRIFDALTKYFGHDPDGQLGHFQQGTDRQIANKAHPPLQQRHQHTDLPNQALQNGHGYAANLQVQSIVPICQCNKPSDLKTVTKDSANKGRTFYGCSTRVCQFFEWADQKSDLRYVVQPEVHSNLPSVQVLQNQAPTFAQQSAAQPMCRCDLHAKRCIVSKQGPNHGKPFWACGKITNQCNFFEWINDSQVALDQNQPNQRSITCFKCGKDGHYSTQCPGGSGSPAKKKLARDTRGGGVATSKQRAPRRKKIN